MESVLHDALYRAAVTHAGEPAGEHGGTRGPDTEREPAAPVAGGGSVRAAGVVLAAAVAVTALIGAGGDFPLSDDWSYAFTARGLCETGELRFLPWTGASLVLQAWYGAALCALLGFSFTVLRASTLVLATLGAIGFLLLLRHAGVRGGALALGTALFALNPLYVSLAFTFMTDVPFTVAAVWAGYCYVRGLGERRTALLVWGSLAATAALLIRQHGIFVAGAAACAALLAAGRSFPQRLASAVAAAALPALAFVAFHVWLLFLHGAPVGYEHKIGEASRLTLAGFANCAFRGIEYLGLFLCPLAVDLARPLRLRHPRLAALWCAGLAVLVVALYLRERAFMFYLTNVLYDFGLGALSLRDTLFLALRPPVALGSALALPLTVVATLAAALLGAAWTADLGRLRSPVPAFLLLALAFLFAGTLLHARYYFDRYLLVVVPFALAATLALHPVAPQSPRAWALAALLSWYAVAGTHDYLAWNRARYAGLAALTAEGVPPTAIDGGMEFNAWHLAAGLGTWPTADEARPGQPPTKRSWWWVVDDRFVVSFRPLPGYAVRQALPYRRWLPPGTGRVVILERE